jgi:hypothetical protein
MPEVMNMGFEVSVPGNEKPLSRPSVSRVDHGTGLRIASPGAAQRDRREHISGRTSEFSGLWPSLLRVRMKSLLVLRSRKGEIESRGGSYVFE